MRRLAITALVAAIERLELAVVVQAPGDSTRSNSLVVMDKAAEHKLIRIGRVAAGMTLLPVGVALLVLPGPGIPLVLGGLMLLEPEFPWAGRARTKLRDFAKNGASWLNRRRHPDSE